MDIDLDLYRHEVRVSTNPLVRLSAIDISPEHPQRTIVFIQGFGGQAEQWQYQLQMFSLENRVVALDLRGHLDPARHTDGPSRWERQFPGRGDLTGTVNGIPGTLSFDVTGMSDLYQAIQLTSTVPSGSAGLAGLHGELSKTGIIKDSGPVGTYIGQINN
jgi:pimeloyl-ACP methyl ester carboxylesterase